jgi:ribokinase
VVGVKLGADGCYVSWRGKAKRVPVRKVRNVVDTTGAGDAFVSGFVAGLLGGSDPFEAAKLGNAVAASSLSAVGASTAIRPVKEYLRS